MVRPVSFIMKEFKFWFVCVILLLPVIIFYLTHYLIHDPHLVPTGFITFDMPYYMANAREHFDTGKFDFLYGNPFSPSYDTPRIYFQPQTLLLGVVKHLSGLDPGIVFVLFGSISSVLCIRVALALYKEVSGFESWPHKLGALVFCWGGGFTALMGVLYTFVKGGGIKAALHSTTLFEVQGGWWFLNLGRNLLYPTEAYYHVLFLGCVFFLIKNKYVTALILASITSISHPFTGIELLLILFTWSFFEFFFIQNHDVPRYFLFGSLGILAFHIGYYLIFLRLFSEHRAHLVQWMGGETLEAIRLIAAYGLVGVLATWTARRLTLAREFFASSRNRFFLIWFLVAFVLINHQFLRTPSIQPLHFTRGYVWIPLFLMGVSSLGALLSFIVTRLSRFASIICIGLIIIFFLSDNIIWFSRFPIKALFRGEHWGYYLTSDQIQVFKWMNEDNNKRFVILSQDPFIGYLVTVYTPLRSWRSHKDITPETEKRKRELESLFNEGVFVDAWRKTPLLIVYNKSLIAKKKPEFMLDRNQKKVFENGSYVIFKRNISTIH
jgi:hypothetical protein